MKLSKTTAKKLTELRYNPNHPSWDYIWDVAAIPKVNTSKLPYGWLMDIICRELALNVPDMFSSNKSRNYSLGRQLFGYILTFKEGLHCYEIAKIMGRHPSTISYGNSKIGEDVRLYPEMNELVNNVISEYKSWKLSNEPILRSRL